MGLLQRAIETYDANAGLVGVYREGHVPLAPIFHIIANAHIEITLTKQGEFCSAKLIEKDQQKTIIPVTEKSGGRTSALVAHPLCDQIMYVAPEIETAYTLYLQELSSWERSTYSHPILTAVRAYVENGTILTDLMNSGILPTNEEIEKKQLKQMVRWRVIGLEDEEPDCWRNTDLFSLFQSYYYDVIAERNHVLCMVSGKNDLTALQHPSGIISNPYKAKLISFNDNGFVYRGRFTEEWQAATIGIIASQKAHNALRWLTSEQGVREYAGKGVFLCWNPAGKTVPRPMRMVRRENAEPIRKPSDYQKQLQSTLLSFRKDHQLQDSDCAVLVSFDAATTGRLAVTYYNEITLKTFLERMEDWDAHCCWYTGGFGIQAANLLQIVERAFGTLRDNSLDVDDLIRRQHLQRLLNCKMNGGVFPLDILRALTQRASSPMDYPKKVWRSIVQTACAALQKYRYDIQQGSNEMAWELDKRDRSFQYGRLLAAMERVEEEFYLKTTRGGRQQDKKSAEEESEPSDSKTQEDERRDSRQTNAIKNMSDFRRRPFSVFERVNRHLQQAYVNRVDPWQANRYNRLVGEIFEILREFPEGELNRSLDDIYLMGYELQRNAFFTKNDTKNNTEEE